MPSNLTRLKTVAAVLVAFTAALIWRAALQTGLIRRGIDATVAADLAYLAVPPALLLLLFPLWRDGKAFVAEQLQPSDLRWAIVWRAVAIGILLRGLWWCKVIAGAAFGLYRSSDPDAITGPVFRFQCAPMATVLLGLLVMALLVPVVEEIVHRGVIVSALRRRGPLVSILVSAAVFAIYHPFSSWGFVFFAGLIMGLQYWRSASLWPSMITHATINGLIQIDWRCLSVQWNPVAESLPVPMPGTIAIVLLLICLAGIAACLRRPATGAASPPRLPNARTRSPRVQ